MLPQIFGVGKEGLRSLEETPEYAGNSLLEVARVRVLTLYAMSGKAPMYIGTTLPIRSLNRLK